MNERIGFMDRIGRVALLATLLLSLSPHLAAAASDSGATVAAPVPDHRPGEIVVLFKGATVPAKFKFASDAEAVAAITEYANDPEVRSVGWNALVRISAERVNPDDEFFYNQWYLEKIRAPEAWKVSQGSRSVVVAVLDTGVDLDHPDLRNNIWTNPYEVLDGLDNDHNGFPDDIHGWDFVNDVGNPRPRFDTGWTEAGVNHGTIVSGIIGAIGMNRIGVAGVTWNVRLMPIKVLDDAGTGDVETVARGIDYAVRNGAQILNLSFVGADQTPVLEAAIDRAASAGVTIVTAAGNDNATNGGHDLDQVPNYPVCNDGGPGRNEVIGVTGTDETDKKANFSGFGTHCVDISAPGVGFYSARYQDIMIPNFGSPYGGFWKGTSLATAVVTGAAALLKSVDPTLTPDEIRNLMTSTAVNTDAQNPSYVGKLGAGRLDLYAAVDKASLTHPEVNVSRAEVGVAAPAGAVPEIKLFTPSGAFVRSFVAYPTTFRGGLNAASGDVDGDYADEIVAAPSSGMAPDVKVFDSSGKQKTDFLAFDAKMTSGVSLAVGDLGGDGRSEIVTGMASGGSEVRVFDGTGKMISAFTVYAPTYKGGVSLAVGDVDADGKNEIVVAPAQGGGPHVRVFDMMGNLKTQFFAGDAKDTRGWKIAVGDTQRQGSAGVGIMPANGLADVLNLYNGLGVLYGVVEFSVKAQNFPFAFGDVDADGRSEVVVSVPTADGLAFSIHDTDGKEKGFAITYAKPATALPNPFVLVRP